ncbi:MAG TPA: ISNCY family transposase [Candidatus Sulfobium mesophilum]|nr:ISNCY family transposase [Candidatus Sulfobium mesophilum]
MKERKKATAVVAARYQKARKKDKGVILDEFTKLTGYGRRYASHVLRCHGRKVRINETCIIQYDVRKTATRKKPKIYDSAVEEALKKVWYIMDCICGKRLAPVLREVVTRLERFHEIKLSEAVRQKLFKISPASIDRLLAKERKRHQIKGRGNTKPGTLLKNQIPIRTFSDWNEQKPGFVEIDLVGHDGGDSRGDFVQTLDVTDVCTTWTETEAVRNKAQIWVFDALKDIRKRMPFPLLGIDSDSGGEFINNQLFRYCQQERITFTRSRSYRKNDGCFVEQKNYSIVRRAVGYLRYDTEEELLTLNELYRSLRLYTNFFQPTMKLIEKTRTGSKVIKKYDRAQTPYRRVLACPDASEADKQALKTLYAKLNPAQLKRQITRLQQKLYKLNAHKRSPLKKTAA